MKSILRATEIILAIYSKNSYCKGYARWQSFSHKNLKIYLRFCSHCLSLPKLTLNLSTQQIHLPFSQGRVPVFRHNFFHKHQRGLAFFHYYKERTFQIWKTSSRHLLAFSWRIASQNYGICDTHAVENAGNAYFPFPQRYYGQTIFKRNNLSDFG